MPDVQPRQAAHRFTDVVAAIDDVVRSIVPAAGPLGGAPASTGPEGGTAIPAGYAMPGDSAPFLLVRVTGAGVDVFVPADSTIPFIRTFSAASEARSPDFEHALRGALTASEARTTNRPRFSELGRSSRGGTALPVAAMVVGGFLAFDAVRWQRVGIVALLPWALIAALILVLTSRLLGETSPDAPGASPLPGILALALAAGGWTLTVRWAYRRFPPTARQRAAAARADTEFIRTNTRALGCIAGGAWLFGAGALLAIVPPEATRGVAGAVAGVVILLGVASIPVVVVWSLRRTFPAGPPSPAARLTDFLLLMLLLVLVALGLFATIATTPSR